MRDLDYLSAILELPKGNEYFFSDIHGEYKSFIHFLRSASGVIRAKIRKKQQVSDLKELLECYKLGLLREK